MEKKDHTIIQQLWAISLIAAGIGVFYRIPVLMKQIESIEQYASMTGFIRFCFYFIGFFLIGGGIKKFYALHKKMKSKV
ncbi:MAG: hypothetical protein HQK77_18980 [Desulfobacterales bacterium]|nr:hypothetical protein [Desulfobacterales bacterium]